MSPRPSLLTLEAFCRDHLERVSREVSLVETTQPEASAGSVPHVRAVASGLHSFYTGIEAILQRIADAFEGRPEGPTSHSDLLRVATFDVAGLRPPVLSRETAERVDAYRSFRHFFRHAYGVDLDYDRMRGKVEEIRVVFALVESDLGRFAAFLRTAAALHPDDAGSS